MNPLDWNSEAAADAAIKEEARDGASDLANYLEYIAQPGHASADFYRWLATMKRDEEAS